jgi:hypothetical protein
VGSGRVITYTANGIVATSIAVVGSAVPWSDGLICVIYMKKLVPGALHLDHSAPSVILHDGCNCTASEPRSEDTWIPHLDTRTRKDMKSERPPY